MRDVALPPDWREVRIGDICDVVTGGTPSKRNPTYWGGEIPWMSSGEVHKRRVCEVDGRITEEGLRNSNARWLPASTVVVALNGQGRTRGTAAFLETATTCNQSIAGVLPRDAEVIPAFLFHNLEWRYVELRHLTGDVARTGLNLKLIRALKVMLPPLPEQRKIAEILSAVDDAIEKTEAVIEQVRRVKQGLAQQLLTRGLPGRHTHYKQTEVGEIPACWEVGRLGEVATVQTGVAKNEKGIRVDPVALPYLRVANVQDGYLDLSEIKTITVDRSEAARFQLQDGDVLFTEGGDPDKLGRGTVWTAPINPCLHQNHVFAVRPNRHQLLPEYLALFAASSAGKRYFLLAAKQTTNLASVNARQLRQLPVALPSLEEQQAIIDSLAALDRRATSEESSLRQLRAAKSALMYALLTGQVRVSVRDDPAETEP